MSSATSGPWTSTSATSAKRSSATPVTPSLSTPPGVSDMFSAKRGQDRDPRRKGPKLPSLGGLMDLTPRLSIRVWLTVLFVLVTAVSAVAAYGIVRPILETSLSRASDATFRQVAEQWDAQIRRDAGPTAQDIQN